MTTCKRQPNGNFSLELDMCQFFVLLCSLFEHSTVTAKEILQACNDSGELTEDLKDYVEIYLKQMKV